MFSQLLYLTNSRLHQPSSRQLATLRESQSRLDTPSQANETVASLVLINNAL
jgi:hypothetical protein